MIPEKVFAVWGVDSLKPDHGSPHHRGRGGGLLGQRRHELDRSRGEVAFPQLDVATINATPPTAYTQVTDPSVGFDGQGNVYVLTLQTSGATDGELYLTEFNFSGYDAERQVRSPTTASSTSGLPAPTRRPARSWPSMRPRQPPRRSRTLMRTTSTSPGPASTPNPPIPIPIPGPASTRTGPSWSSGLPFPIRQANEESLAFSGVTDRQCGWQLRPAARFAPAARDQPE